ILVPVGFEEATRYIPPFGPPGLVEDLQWVAIGLLILVFLWFRPQGILPERRRLTGGADGATGRLVTRSAPSTAGSADGGVMLRTADLTRDFGGVRAVAGVSIEVRRGTLTGLI